MSPRLAKVLDLVERLPQKERVELTRELVSRLTANPDELNDSAFQGELRRRAAAVLDGTAKLVPWAKARKLALR